MKVRTDFVSNSSSSSFIIAYDGAYNNAILKEIAKKSVNKKNEWHRPGLEAKNKLVLDFCVNTFELMFLGELLLETKEHEYMLETFKDIYGEESAANEFARYKDTVAKAKRRNAQKWLKDEYGKDKKVSDDVYIHYERVTAQSIVIPHSLMEYRCLRYHIKDSSGNEIPDRPEDKKRRVDAMISIAKAKVNQRYVEDSIGSIDTYRITADTIANTRDLIKAGYKVTFEDWESLDKLEERISAGQKIIYLRIAHSGEGYGDFYIYCEEGANGLDGVDGIEILHGYCG